jgi:hypothetical protein
MQNSPFILIGNSFPLSLIRRPIRIEPRTREQLLLVAFQKEIISFWGHPNTLRRVEQFTGLSLAPQNERPIIQLDPKSRLPQLYGQTFCECWVLSPDYISSFRPAVGEEVPPEKIAGWQILKLTWE